MGMKRTNVNGMLITGALAAGALGAYAFLIEPRWLQVTRTGVHIRGLPAALEGLRIGLLSDLHAGSRVAPLIRRACRLVMAERPDVIALTGDFGGGDPHGLRRLLETLAGLQAPLGVYAVPGNHDHALGIDMWHREVGEQERIVDLTNKAVLHEVDGAHLCLAGVDDLTTGDPHLEEILPASSRADLTILLAHNPDQAEQARPLFRQVDLVLSGHTHAGQVRLPLIGALLNPARHDNLYEAGLVRRPWTQVYVSRGVGTVHLPLRFLSRPEVALLELTRLHPDG